MLVTYRNHKIEEICTVRVTCIKKFGPRMTDLIQKRLFQLSHFNNVNQLVEGNVGRCHKLSGDRLGQYAMDLVHPYRLIFILVNNDIEVCMIEEIVDYH